MERSTPRTLLIPAYGLAALGTPVTYFYLSAGLIAGIDGIAQGSYFLGSILSILSVLALLALFRVWAIGARLWRYGRYANASPQTRRYDAAGVVAATAALIGFSAIAKAIGRATEVIFFGILLGPAAVLAITAFIRGRTKSQVDASAVAMGADTDFFPRVHVLDLLGLVCGTVICVLAIDYLVPRPTSGWGHCKWTWLYPIHAPLWPTEPLVMFDGCNRGSEMYFLLGLSLSFVCLLAGAIAAYIGRRVNPRRGAVATSLAVAMVFVVLIADVLRNPHEYLSWARSIILAVLVVVGSGCVGYMGGQAARGLWRPRAGSTSTVAVK